MRLPNRATIALVASLLVPLNAKAEDASANLAGLFAHIPRAKLSNGRGALDRTTAAGDGALSPSGLVVSAPMLLLGAKSLQAQDAGELVTWTKARGRAVRMVHTGAWSASLECALQLQEILETRFTLVAAADLADALGKLRMGAVDVMCEAVPSVIADVRSGDVIAYVLASDERLPALWDVATADQAGLPLFSATAWLGLYAATPEPDAIRKALTDDVVQKLADIGWTPFAPSHQTVEAHQQQLASETERRKDQLNDEGLPKGP